MIPQIQNQEYTQYFESIIKNCHEYQYFKNNNDEFQKLIKINDSQFINYLIDQFQYKNIIYIRHAESPINVWVQNHPIKFMFSLYPSDPNLYNPGVTDEGKKQCTELKNKLDFNQQQFHQDVNKNNNNIQDQEDLLPTSYDLVVVSPYKRTITTYDEIRESKVFQHAKVQTSSYIRERASIPASVVGYSSSFILSHRKDINCDFITKDKWWRQYEQSQDDSISKIEKIKRESNTELQFRVLIFLIWMVLREEKNIIFISHCAVYEAIKLFKTKKPKNAIPYKISKQDFLNLYKQFFHKNPNL